MNESDKADEKRLRYLLAAGLIFLSLWVWWVTTGEARPGVFHEKKSYNAKLYVNVFPDSKNAKNYRLVADINKSDEEEGAVYYIEKVYWPNGGSLDFDNGSCIAEMQRKTKVLKALCTHVSDPGEASEKETDYTIEVTQELAQ